jgi:hypothetical protein
MPVPSNLPNKRKSGGCLPACLEWVFFATFFCTLLFILVSVISAFDLPVHVFASEVVPSSEQNTYLSGSSSQPSCQVSARFPDKILQWCHWITRYALDHDLSPDLIAALIWQESGGNPQAYSHSGAVGLMQIMPSDGIATKFMCKNGPCFADRPLTSDLHEAEFNIFYGTKLLRKLINHHKGDIRSALKSYGPMDVGYHYADTVLALYHRYGVLTQP